MFGKVVTTQHCRNPNFSPVFGLKTLPRLAAVTVLFDSKTLEAQSSFLSLSCNMASGPAPAKSKLDWAYRRECMRLAGGHVCLRELHQFVLFPYLRDTIGRIAEHKINRITELLPWNWKKHQGSAKTGP
jgi:hypothetical protein